MKDSRIEWKKKRSKSKNLNEKKLINISFSQKEQMMQAEKEAHAMKLAKKEEEENLEREYRRAMMEKFAQDDKLEQLSQQKRRMKELEHKKEVFLIIKHFFLTLN